jgi:NTE family protein
MPDTAAASTALVMSGGGARAAYQIGVLRAIVRRWPDFSPPIITGVSAGAINAAALATRSASFAEAVGLLTRLWSGLTTEQVFRTDPASFSDIGLRWARRLSSAGRAGRRARGLVDTEPLRDLLTRVVGPNGGECVDANVFAGRLDAFAVTATDYGTGRSVTWVQGRGVHAWDHPSRHSIRSRIGVEHVMASAALPLFFPAVRVEGAWYGDGGIRQVAPLSPALYLGARRILAVSTRWPRTAEEASVPVVADYPPPAQILGVLMNAVFLDTLDQDVKMARRISRLTRRLPEDRRDGLRPVEILMIRPSQDLSRLAADYEVELPRTFRYLMRGLGTRETNSPDWLSMLLFEPAFLRRIMDLGEADAEARISEIGTFLGRSRQE